MAHRIDMGGTVVAEQNAPGFVREIRAQLPLAFLVRQVRPDHCFQVPGINGHSIVNFLGQIDDFTLKHGLPP